MYTHIHTKIFCRCLKSFLTTLRSSTIVNYLYKLAHYEQGSSHIKSDETVNNFILDAIALSDTCISSPITQNQETRRHQEHILFISSRKRDIISFPGMNFLTHSNSNFHFSFPKPDTNSTCTMDQNISFLKNLYKPAVCKVPFLFYWLAANGFLHRPRHSERTLQQHPTHGVV